MSTSTSASLAPFDSNVVLMFFGGDLVTKSSIHLLIELPNHFFNFCVVRLLRHPPMFSPGEAPESTNATPRRPLNDLNAPFMILLRIGLASASRTSLGREQKEI